MKARLIKEKNGEFFAKDIILQDRPEKLKGLLNDTSWTILKALAERPSYPAEVAKRLKIHEQKVYYHIKQLYSSGLLQIVRKEERSGSLAKYFAPTGYAYALELPFGDEKVAGIAEKKQNESLKKFLYPSIKRGIFDALFVVGSPEPHGPHQVRARDGHLAIELAFFIGQMCAFPKKPISFLDVELKAQGKMGSNLIVIGGILTNVITSELNKYLPIKFDERHFPYRQIISEKTGKTYSGENLGIIAKCANPFNKEKSAIIIAGNTYEGTRAAILALTKKSDELFSGYEREDVWATFVEGLDMDADGKVDNIRKLE